MTCMSMTAVQGRLRMICHEELLRGAQVAAILQGVTLVYSDLGRGCAQGSGRDDPGPAPKQELKQEPKLKLKPKATSSTEACRCRPPARYSGDDGAEMEASLVDWTADPV